MGSLMQSRGSPEVAAPEDESLSLLDVAVGVSAQAVATVGAVGRGVQSVVGPVADVVLRPPILGPRLQPATWLSGLARRGGLRRRELFREVADVLDVAVPAVVAELVRRLDLTELVNRYVDVDRIVSEVDLDRAASRLDIDAVASRLDVDAIVSRLDLTEIARQQLDLDGLVATVDLDAVAARLDLDAAAARLDLEAVIDRIDLVGLANDVIAEIDLPEIIRESTGSVASDSLRAVRIQSISGDDAIARAVERLRLRRDRRAGTEGRLSPPKPGAPRTT